MRIPGVLVGFTAALLLVNGGPGAAELVGVKKMSHTIRDFRLQNGAVLPEATIAYESYGKLAADGRNAVLVTHGFTSSHHAAGKYQSTDEAVGWWDGLIGPGKAIDTDKLFVVSSNMLGSSYGSTSPACINPKTGKAYGPGFPEISVVDIVSAQKRLLDHLGVKHLVAVAGPSYGGYQAFQWGVTFPDAMDGLVAVVSAPAGSGGDAAIDSMVAGLAKDPNWNGGWYYDKGGIVPTMLAQRVATLKRYGIDAQLAPKFPDTAEREAAIRKIAEPWAREFDANGMVALRRASVRYDAAKDFKKIKAKLLYVLSSTDNLFPPSIAPDVMAKLKAAGVDATYFQLESEYGHLASGRDAGKWAPALKRFMDSLADRRG